MKELFFSNKKIKDVYVVLFYIFLSLLVMRIIITNGMVLRNVLWTDQLDTGMDFFNSIICTKDAEPYTRFKTLYPPLANMFYYLIYLCVPENITVNWNVDYTNWTSLRGTGFDARIWQVPSFLFIVYNLIVGISTINLFRKTIYDYSDLLGYALLFSSGMLFAWERGNIIIATMLLVLYFVLNYKKDAIKKEFALISLSIAIGLKLYPVVFSLLLLKRKMYKEFLRVVLYSAVLVLLPLVLFGGLDGLYVWIDVVRGFGAGANVNIGAYFYGFIQIVMYFAKSFEDLISNPDFLNWLRLCVGIFTVVLLSCFWNTKEEWKEYLVLSLILVLAQQNSPMYNTIFFLIPFIFFINKEDMITKDNLWYFVFFVIWFVPMSVFNSRKIYTVFKMASLMILAGSLVVFEIKKWKNYIWGNCKSVD